MPLDGNKNATIDISETQPQDGSPILIPVGPGDKPAVFNLSLDFNGALSCFLSDINSWLSHRPNNDQLIDRLVRCCKSNLELVPINFDLALKSVLKDYAAWFEELFSLLLPLLGPESAVLQLACFREQIRSKLRYARLLTLVDHIEEMLSNLTSAHEVSKGALTETLKAFAILLSLIAVLAPLRQQTLDLQHPSTASPPQIMLLPISQIGFGASVSVVPSEIRGGSVNLKVYQDTLCKWSHSTINFEHTAIFYPETERLAALESYVNCVRASRNFEIIHQSFDGSVKTGNQIPLRISQLSGVNSVSNIIFDESVSDYESQLAREPLGERDRQDELKGTQQDVVSFTNPQTGKTREKMLSKHQSIGENRTLVTSTNLDQSLFDDTRSSAIDPILQKPMKNSLVNSEEKACQIGEKEDNVPLQETVASDKSCEPPVPVSSPSISNEVSPDQCPWDRISSKPLRRRATSSISSYICEDVGVFGGLSTQEHRKEVITVHQSMGEKRTSGTSTRVGRALFDDARSSVIDPILQKPMKNSLVNSEEKACQTGEKEDEIALQGSVASDKSCEPPSPISSPSTDNEACPNQCPWDRISSKPSCERATSCKLSCICEDFGVFGGLSTQHSSCICEDVEALSSVNTERAPEEIEIVDQSIGKKQTSSDEEEERQVDEEDEAMSKVTVISNKTCGCSTSIQNLSFNTDVESTQQTFTILQQVISDKRPEDRNTEVREKDKRSRGRPTKQEVSELRDRTSFQFLLTGGNAKQHERMLVELQKLILRNDLTIVETRARCKELSDGENRGSGFAQLDHCDIRKEKYHDGSVEYEPWLPQMISGCGSQITSKFRIKEGAPLIFTQPWKIKRERCRMVRSLNRQYLREEASSFAEAHVVDQTVIVDNKSDCEALIHRCPRKFSNSSICRRLIRSGTLIHPTRLCLDCFKRRKHLWGRQKALRDQEAKTFLAQHLVKESAHSREVSEPYQKGMVDIELAKINVASKRCSNDKFVTTIKAEFPVKMVKKAMKNGKNVKFVFDIAVPENMKNN